MNVPRFTDIRKKKAKLVQIFVDAAIQKGWSDAEKRAPDAKSLKRFLKSLNSPENCEERDSSSSSSSSNRSSSSSRTGKKKRRKRKKKDASSSESDVLDLDSDEGCVCTY